MTVERKSSTDKKEHVLPQSFTHVPAHGSVRRSDRSGANERVRYRLLAATKRCSSPRAAGGLDRDSIGGTDIHWKSV